jgi:Holliday junction resolvase RusA-like endonuclease
VKFAWLQSGHAKITGAVSLVVNFYFQRPKSVKRQHPEVKPDLDKLLRSTLDALVEAGAIEDDAKVVAVTACKIYSDAPVGASLHLVAVK